ncbi:MAG: SAF domain-containing protein [Terracidiphilus sp.]
MNRRLITIFLVAIAIASAACWLVYRIVNVKLSSAKPLSTTQVIAASKDIPLGAVLTTADLTTMTLTGTPPKGALVKQEDAVGRGVITNIPQGEPILDSQLAVLGPAVDWRQRFRKACGRAPCAWMKLWVWRAS